MSTRKDIKPGMYVYNKKARYTAFVNSISVNEVGQPNMHLEGIGIRNITHVFMPVPKRRARMEFCPEL